MATLFYTFVSYNKLGNHEINGGLKNEKLDLQLLHLVLTNFARNS